MRTTTNAIHEQVSALGNKLGFVVRREVSDSVLSLRLDAAYTPRADLLWSLELTSAQSSALGIVAGETPEHLHHLPVVGIEVEGTTPTTKTIAADVANIASLGTKLGLMIVSDEGEAGIYRRAARAVRTMRRSFGDLAIVPMDASWVQKLNDLSWSQGRSVVAAPKGRAPAGGESLDWSRNTRAWLREIGEQAGFVVVEPYTPQILEMTFNAEKRRRKEPLAHLYEPLSARFEPMNRFGDYLTACQIDQAWLLPLPKALREFLAEIARLDPHVFDYGNFFPELYDHVAVAGFELESSAGKHAAGGLLNLSAYCTLGVCVSPTQELGTGIEDILKRYRPTLGLRNVRVLVHE